MNQENSGTYMESPLIPSSEKELRYGDVDDDGLVENNRYSEMILELKKQMVLAGPLVVVSFLQCSFLMISVMFVGHLDELSLSSASLATSFAGVTGFSFMLGMGSALETLCGQAYGAKQYHMLGIHMQRAMLVLTLVSIPIALLWCFAEDVFRVLRQDEKISMHAGVYARWLIPGILPFGLLQCQMRFLQTQSQVLPLMMSTAIASLVHVIACWTSIFSFGFGNKGAALSIAFSYWVNVFVLALYIKFSPACEKTWTGFSTEALRNLVEFLEMGIPSALMVCSEQWSYEFLVFMSGLLPNPKLQTSLMSISMNTCTVIFRVPFALGSVASTRVSNELGAGRPYAASRATQIAIFLAVTEGLSVNTIAIALRNIWGYMYTNEEEVVGYLASIMPVLALSNLMDAMQAVLSGVARGCGWQKIGAYVNLGSYYIAGVPTAVILTFVFHFGVKGLWMGIICGSGLQSILLLAITMCTNWELQAKKARGRVVASRIPEHEVP